MVKKFLVILLLVAVAGFSQTADPGKTPRWDGLMDYIKNGSYTFTYKTLTSPVLTTPTMSGAVVGNFFVASDGDSVKLRTQKYLYPLEVETGNVQKFAVDSVGNAIFAGTVSASAFSPTATSTIQARIINIIADTDTLTIDATTALNQFMLRANGTGIFRVDSSGNTLIAGTLKSNGAVTFGSVVSAGILGGAGTSTSALQTLGAAGGKAFSFYVGSTSTTASDAVTGFYLNTNYGTSGASAAPSGDAIRGRAYLVGDASGGTMISGGNFTTELAATTASNTGLTMGLKGNLVIPDGIMTNAGTYHGIQAELYLSGAAVNTTAYTEISPLSVCVSGTSPTSAAQVANIDAITFDFPSNMVASDATVMVTGGAGDTCDAKLRIDVNGTKYWIMLSTDDE
jgi:hypothetical protein